MQFSIEKVTPMLTHPCPKNDHIMSGIYSGCAILFNKKGTFVAEYAIPKSYHTLSPNDPECKIYAEAAKKLFKEIEISEQDLWVCCQNSLPPIRVYVTQPKYYIVSSCCKRCLYISFEYGLSGKMVCSGCEKQCFQFVHTHDPNEKCEKVFREKKVDISSQKEKVRKLISSKRYRKKNLNSLLKGSKPQKARNIGEFVIEVKENVGACVRVPKKEEKCADKCSQSLEELKDIIEEIFS